MGGHDEGAGMSASARPEIVKRPRDFLGLFNAEIEARVLGTVLRDADAYEWAADLGPGDFGLEIHGRIWREIQKVAVDIQPSVGNVYESMGSNLEAVGGLSGLIELTAQAVEPVLLKRFVKEIRQYSAERHEARLGLKINEHLELGDIEGAVAAAQQFIESRETQSTGRGRIEDLPPVGESSPELCYIVPDVLAEGSMTLLTGDSSHGKTTLVFAWMRDANAEGRAALVLDRDNNPRERVLERMNRIGLVDGPLLRVWGGWNQHEAPSPDSPEVLAWIRKCDPKPIVLMDPFLRFLDGGDENSSTDVRATMHRGRRLANLGAGVIVSHHDGKAESSRDYRGSSDLKASVDQAFHLSNFSLDGTKLDRLTLRCYKSRYGVEGSLLYRYAGGQCVRDESPGATARTQADRLTDLLRMNPGIGSKAFEDLAVKGGMGRNRARDFLPNGISGGVVRRETGARNQLRHYLVEAE